jgi:hypothetical protein
VIDISQQRCFNHADREAVARCLQCGRTFCRECVTEHEARLICARCLAALVQAPARRRARVVSILSGSWCLLSAFFLWAVFYYLGKVLLALPSSFHESAFWSSFK